MLWPAGLLQQFGMGLLKEKGLEELADDTQGTAPVSSSRAAYVREFGGSWPPGWGEPGWQSFASPCARSRGGTANESVHS